MDIAGRAIKLRAKNKNVVLVAWILDGLSEFVMLIAHGVQNILGPLGNIPVLLLDSLTMKWHHMRV